MAGHHLRLTVGIRLGFLPRWSSDHEQHGEERLGCWTVFAYSDVWRWSLESAERSQSTMLATHQARAAAERPRTPTPLNSSSGSQHEKVDHWLKRSLPPAVHQGVRTLHSCIVQKNYRFVLLAGDGLYLTENPPKTVRRLLTWQDVKSIETVSRESC